MVTASNKPLKNSRASLEGIHLDIIHEYIAVEEISLNQKGA